MKQEKLFTFLVFTFLSTQLFGQKEGYLWYFGKNLGLDFNTNPPTLLTDSKINTVEGCSSISDKDGKLVLYTDGTVVWNKYHEVIEGASDLHGHPSSTQSGIIVTKPKSTSIYYVFTVDASENGLEGLEYAEIDVTANAGKGKVIKKHQLLLKDATEKVTGVVHKNGKDVWILTHQWESDAFYAFLVTENGVEKQPIISKVGTKHQGNLLNSIGYLKASPKGDKLAIAPHEDNLFEVFDFDNTTGIVSNPVILKFEHGSGYGIEFSPSGRFLYTSTVFDGEIAQYDLNEKNLVESKVVLRKSDNKSVGALQLAPDGKIYYQLYSGSSLGTINFPEKKGKECEIKENTISLPSNIARFGLPTFVQTYFSEENIKETQLIAKKVEGISADFSTKGGDIMPISVVETVKEVSKKHFQIGIITKEKKYEFENQPNSKVIGTNTLRNVSVKDEGRFFYTNLDGRWVKEGKEGENYQLTFMKEGYFSQTLTITPQMIEQKLKENNIATFEIVLERMFKDMEIILDNVYYDYDSVNVQETSIIVLNNLLKVLKENPTMSIELASYTDCRGTDEYNQMLSQRRAESVVKYLIQNGIDASRLTAKGYGESALVTFCDCETCTESEYQANRRTTFRIK